MRHSKKREPGHGSALRRGWRLMPRALPYLRPYRRPAGASMGITVILALLALAQPWPLALVIDTVLSGKAVPFWVPGFVPDDKTALILTAVGASLLITLLHGAFSIVNEYLTTSVNLKLILDFRSEMYQHVQRLSPSYHDENKSGVTLYRINNQAGAIGPILTTLPEFAQNLFTVAGMAFIAYQIDAPLALVALAVVPVIMHATHYYAEEIEPPLLEVRALEGMNLSMVHEALAMFRVIVTFGREKHEFARFRRQGDTAVRARVTLTVRQTVFKLVVNFVTAAGTAAVLGWGAHGVLAGDITVGELTVVLSYVAAVYSPLEALTNTMTWYQMYWSEFDHALQLLDEPIEVVERPGARDIGRAEGELEFEDVDFSYETRPDVLTKVSFHVPAGRSVAIVGPTGAGKSTLVSLMPRLYDPVNGAVLLDGQPLGELTLDSLRAQFSIVLQEPLLFSGTIAENIHYGRLDATQEEVEEAARNANAHDFIAKLPQGYKTVLGERGVKISGGERQRIAVARAFLRDAPILILDEPTSSIDSRTEEAILDALDRLMVGRTTVMIAHRLSTVRHVDEILVLHHGQIVQRGTHEALAAADGLYRQLWEAQSRVRRPREHGEAGLRLVPAPTRPRPKRDGVSEGRHRVVGEDEDVG
jgi:ATP-binding cassette, subfamily B, bacterial